MGKNIKQKTTRTSPTLDDFLYLVAGTKDYNVRLQAIKDLFGVETEKWHETTLSHSTTSYLDTVDSTVYAVVKIEYLAKRGSRPFHSGVITAIYNRNDVLSSDNWENIDPDGLGLSISAKISSGFIQLELSVDGSDANDITFNYKIVAKKPITV